MQTHGHLKFVFKIFIRLSYTKNACSRNYQIFSNIYRASFVSSAEATNLPPQLFLGESLTYYKYSVPIQLMYSVSTQAWHVVLIQQCGFQNLNDNSIFMVRGIYETGSIFLIVLIVLKANLVSGDITFKNPYGFLPALEYGMLPFTVSFICSC